MNDFEQMKPTFQRHSAIILQILLKQHSFQGLTDDQVQDALANWLRDERTKLREKGKPVPKGRKKPTVDNRLRDLAHAQNPPMVVRIVGRDGRKHNFHPNIFRQLAQKNLAHLSKFFTPKEIHDWMQRIDPFFKKVKE